MAKSGLAKCGHYQQDTHGTRGPVRGKAVGGPTSPRRVGRQTTHDRQGFETNVLSVNNKKEHGNN